jgi:WD repeat-containing protein 35
MAKDEDDDIVSSGSETESESEEDEDTGLTENQNRLLYMISLYSHKATPGTDEKDEWVRKPALIVLLYEGIVAGVLDFDYAPSSQYIENRRVYLNVSQEGKSDVEFLREEELVNGLQMSSKSFQPITCYQISEKGKELVKRISRKEKEAVHEFVYARGTRELLSALWDGRAYWLESKSGYRRKSTITDTEDVSYVSSAYIPQCLRYGGRPTLSNAHRAHESGVSADNIRDELDEVITLNSVSIIVAEYIPFGANQIVQLNNNVGSTERVQGGYISPAVDDHAADTQVEMSPELTQVDILDYTLTNHINFEAEINFAEESGVIQVETFGVSLNAEGTCFYGLQVEAVMDRIKDNISLDHLSRLLVDVQQDSSAIVDSIISQYQREMMQLVFLGDADNRNKVNLIIANEITPHLTAEEYMDKGEYENELKQVIGDTKAAYDISEHDTLIFGAYGLLVAGPNSRHHEPLLCAYLQFITIDIFLQNFFARLWIMNDDMRTTNKIIEHAEKDPRALKRIRYRICALAEDVIMMEEILSYLLEALEIIEIPPEPPEQAGRSLYERLEISGMRNQLVRRAMDLKKNIAGCHRNLDVLREKSSAVSESKMFHLNEAVDLNTKKMCDLQESNEKSARSLAILQVIFAGMLAFDVLDRLTGPDWSVRSSPWFASFYDGLILATPALWFLVNLIFWILTALLVIYIYNSNNDVAQGITTVRLRIDRKVFTHKLREFLRGKLHSYEERNYDTDNDIVKMTYTDALKHDWGGCRPTITFEYDDRNGYLLTIVVIYNRRKAKKTFAMTAEELREKILDELNNMDVWDIKGEDRSEEDLASDKRAAIQRLLDAEEDDDDEEGGANT